MMFDGFIFNINAHIKSNIDNCYSKYIFTKIDRVQKRTYMENDYIGTIYRIMNFYVIDFCSFVTDSS